MAGSTIDLGRHATPEASDFAPLSEASIFPPPLAVGTSVGSRYVITRRLGAGGMGVVYAAHDLELGRPVALKVLKGSLAIDEREARDRLRREAQALAALSHPNVVEIYDVDTVDGQVVLTMEFVDGLTLSAWLALQPRPWREIVSVFALAGEGLAAAHAAEIVHRDFKPSNVIVDDRPRAGAGQPVVKVLDFGLARGLHLRTDGRSASGSAVSADDPPAKPLPSRDLDETDAGDRLTATGTVMGTPLFMSPEQQRAQRVDARSDQFSFCVAMWRALYGSAPYPGRNGIELSESFARGRIAEPRNVRQVPRSVRRALERGLAIDADRRFASMRDLLDALGSARRARLRYTAALAFGVTLLGAGFASSAAPNGVDRGCGAGAEKWEQVWSEPLRREVAARFAASDDPYARQAWSRVSVRLDAYGDAWLETFEELCRAVPHGDDLGVELDLRMRCLDQRLDQVDALAVVLAAADATTVRNAVLAVRDLPAIEPCMRTPVSRSGSRPREHSAADGRLERARSKLIEINVLLAAGRYEDGLVSASRLEEEARALGDAPLLAEAMFAIGRGLERTERFEEAVEVLERAEFEARTSNHEELMPAIIDRLVYVLGQQLGRSDEAMEWGRHGLAAADRLPDGRVARGRILTSIGNAQRNLGQYEESLASSERARDLLVDAQGNDSPDVARAWNNIANALFLLSRIDEARTAYETAADIWADALGSDHPDAVIPFANLARIRGRDGRYDEANRLSERVLEVWTRAYGPDSFQLTIPLGNLAEDNRQVGNYRASLGYDEQALRLYQAKLGADHPATTPPLYGLGMSHYWMGEYEVALGYFERVLDIRERAYGSDDRRLSLTLCKIALCDAELDRADAALSAADRALAIATAAEAPDSPALARMHYTKATVLLLLGRDAEAIEHLERTLTLRAGPTLYHPDEVGGPKFDLARAWIATGGDPTRARQLALEAAEAYESWGNGEVAERGAEIRAWVAALR